jgi:hypothetical protein
VVDKVTMNNFIEESVLRIDEAGFGSIFLAEYLIFEEIIEQYQNQVISYQEGITLMVNAAREIYWDENFDPAESSWYSLVEKLTAADSDRFASH